jgi:hypothetical protein
MTGAKRWAGLEAQAVLALRLAVGYGLNEETLATRYTKRRWLRVIRRDVGYGLNEKREKLAAEYKVAAERRAVPLTRTTR